MQDFEPGDTVLADGEPILVIAKTILAANEPVYNLEILGEHVYEAGWSRVLVHNTDAACEAFLKEVDDLAKTEDSKGAAELFWRKLGEFKGNSNLSGKQLEALERLKKAFTPPSGLGSASRLSADELATGRRIETELGKTLQESTHIGADYVDDLGQTYDALGGFDPRFWNEKKFLHQINKHLLKSNNFTVIDLTGFSQAQIGAVRRHLTTLSPQQMSHVIQIGF